MTTAHLNDQLDPVLLAQMLEQQYVKIQRHPTLDLNIYNYTSRAQFDRVWNDVTLRCRGLITDGAGNIVARPFAKFFNHGEVDASLLPAGPVTVTDKLDGSLGILYKAGDRYAIATRGSFASEQALHATSVWESRYASSFQPDPSLTYLFEIIYPSNRIVVDYAGLDDLVLLGAVDTATGVGVELSRARKGWTGPVVTEFEYSTLVEALAAPGRPNAEGLVVHFHADDSRLKIKQDDYVRLHRLVTGVSERRVWEALSLGVDIDFWLESVPDEFYSFVTTTRDRMLAEHARLTEEVRNRFDELVASLPQGWGRKEFAIAAGQLPKTQLNRSMFLLLDGKSSSEMVWRELRPVEHVPMYNISEDTN